MNPQTKGVLQKKMKERSGTQMCVSRGERLRMSLFPLKMMDRRPDDGRGCRKHKIICRKKEFGFDNFMLKMMVEYSDKGFLRDSDVGSERWKHLPIIFDTLPT